METCCSKTQCLSHLTCGMSVKMSTRLEAECIIERINKTRENEYTCVSSSVFANSPPIENREHLSPRQSEPGM
jgi:hypothetical protein